ncbi:hypothetical protein [Clostridium hydrogeniformans]|uniref:hypothetical protein n=1 Tax=Clostridium hydrogeniformans TaxID=349933 RepID=UPI0004898559|nr:hypothetical protein [Clostridium hydrogeniformans]
MKNRKLEDILKKLTWVLIVIIFLGFLLKHLMGSEIEINILIGILVIVTGVRGLLSKSVLIGKGNLNLEYKEDSKVGKIANILVVMGGVIIITVSIIFI